MVEINTERKAVEIKWNASLSSSATIVIRATGKAGDVHNTASLPNDGLAPVSYPSDFSGSSLIEILDVDGNMFDSGNISV